MSRNVVILIMLILYGACMFYSGYLIGRIKSKIIGVIHIEKVPDNEGMDSVRFEFGIQSLEELYDMKDCQFIIDYKERTTNNSDNDNT